VLGIEKKCWESRKSVRNREKLRKSAILTGNPGIPGSGAKVADSPAALMQLGTVKVLKIVKFGVLEDFWVQNPRGGMYRAGFCRGLFSVFSEKGLP